MTKSIGLNGTTGLVFAVLAVTLPAPALAAPQALGLVATERSVPLNCSGGTCTAELSSFCLQKMRVSPFSGTPYHLASADTISLVGLTGSGQTVAIDPKSALKFVSVRSHYAVRVSARSDLLKQKGVVSVSIRINEGATLFPQPVAGDGNPFTEHEKADLVGPLRKLATTIVDRDPIRMGAARLTSRMINRLSQNRSDSASVEQAWKHARVASGRRDRSTGMARRALKICHRQVGSEPQAALKACLQRHHDQFIVNLNTKFWKATDAGS